MAFAAQYVCTVFAQSGDVDIHASAPNTILEMRVRLARGRYELRNATLVDLIKTAWSVDADAVAGGPDWLDSDRFDVIAKAPPLATAPMLNGILKGLLKDRFQLSVHSDTRNRPAYAITAGKKPGMAPANGSEETGCNAQRGARPTITLVCRNMTMASFAKTLPGIREASGYLFNYPVLDRTGLAGAWNFSLEWSPRRAVLATPLTAETIPFFDAVEKQLGLEMKPIQVPAPVVMVDSVNRKPAANPPGATEELSPRPEFEVAAIKPEEGGEGSSIKIERGGAVRINMSLLGLIEEAWGEWKAQRIVGGPKSMGSTRWVVVAKAPVDQDAVAGWNGPVWNGVDVDSMRMMLRALLIDRFQLAAHLEDRMVSGFALVAAKPKLRKADPSHRAGCREGPGSDGKDPRLANPLASRLVTCRNMTLSQFAGKLSGFLPGDAPVVDSTGIAGRYDMTINFSPPSAFPNVKAPNPGDDAAASEPSGAISIFAALGKQLGLKLQSRKVTAPVLVIDHVNEGPTEN